APLWRGEAGPDPRLSARAGGGGGSRGSRAGRRARTQGLPPTRAGLQRPRCEPAPQLGVARGRSKMRRTLALMVAIAVGILAAPLGAEAQQAGKVPRIGVMAVAPTPNLVEAWRQGLRQRGWIEGENVLVEYRYSQGRDESFPDFASELVRLKVDVILAAGDPAVRA